MSPSTEDAVPAHKAPELAIPLRAGPLRLVFDRGALRWIRLGEREVLRGIYFAVRSEGWVTIVPTLEDLELKVEVDSFQIGFHARHERGPVRFAWEGRVTGASDGRIVFSASGAAGASFLRNRIGLCVLHPARACAGHECIVQTVDGDRAFSVFPAYVAPYQPFRNVRAILHEVSPGVEVEVRMEGETFETEDQGNWGDASFKTYGTPLHLPFPVQVEAGAKVEQTVTLKIFGITAAPVEEAAASVPGALPKKRNSSEPVVVNVEPGEGPALPAIGLAGAERAVEPGELERLRPLRLAHLRADLRLDAPGWSEALDRAAANAKPLDVPLELALFLPDEPLALLRDLQARLASLAGVRVASFLVYRADGLTTEPVLAAYRHTLGMAFRGATLAGGSDANFAELNRNRPSRGSLARLVTGFSPQVHQFDDATMVENLAGPARIAETMRSFADGSPLGLSPVTLRPRRDATPSAWREAGEVPFTDDPRQATSFAAAWTLGFLGAAAEAGFASVTLYELAGPRGVQTGGAAFPVLGALADVASVAGGRIGQARSRRPERVQAVALRAGGRVRLFLGNVTNEPHPVRVEGLSGTARRSALGAVGPGEETGFELELAPREVVRLDV